MLTSPKPIVPIINPKIKVKTNQITVPKINDKNHFIVRILTPTKEIVKGASHY